MIVSSSGDGVAVGDSVAAGVGVLGLGVGSSVAVGDVVCADRAPVVRPLRPNDNASARYLQLDTRDPQFMWPIFGSKSMSLQKSMYFFGQLRPDTFGAGDFFHAGFSQSVDRPELSKQQVFPVLTYSGTVVQDAFADPFLHQELMISVGKAVRFVPDSLEQSQGSGIYRQLKR